MSSANGRLVNTFQLTIGHVEPLASYGCGSGTCVGLSWNGELREVVVNYISFARWPTEQHRLPL